MEEIVKGVDIEFILISKEILFDEKEVRGICKGNQVEQLIVIYFFVGLLY